VDATLAGGISRGRPWVSSLRSTRTAPPIAAASEPLIDGTTRTRWACRAKVRRSTSCWMSAWKPDRHRGRPGVPAARREPLQRRVRVCAGQGPMGLRPGRPSLGRRDEDLEHPRGPATTQRGVLAGPQRLAPATVTPARRPPQPAGVTRRPPLRMNWGTWNERCEPLSRPGGTVPPPTNSWPPPLNISSPGGRRSGRASPPGAARLPGAGPGPRGPAEPAPTRPRSGFVMARVRRTATAGSTHPAA
jgi:hypothetical protein